MSTVINSIDYQFDPDNMTQQLCESLARKLEGNGLERSDILAVNAETFDITMTSVFNWAVEVSLKSQTVADKYRKNVQFHKSLDEAQNIAKQQGLHIRNNALGKIELINNINDDPVHYFCHTSAKLTGGPAHAILSKCKQLCNKGQLTCPRCHGKGTHKATTKKEDFLGTSGNFAVQNTCPQCKGKGTVTCSTCEGSGVQTLLFQVIVDATRQSEDKIDTNASVKKSIESYISKHSHQELLTIFQQPVVTQLEDIDQNHCAVTYRAKTRAVRLTLTILNREYVVIGIGDKGECIQQPAILDDILPEKLQRIIGTIPAVSSTRKCMKIKSMPLLQSLLEQDTSTDTDGLATQTLLRHAGGLLTKAGATQIINSLQLMKKHLIPRYSVLAWLPFIVIGMLSGFYFGLGQKNLATTASIVSIHVLLVLSLGYFTSKQLTQYRRNKLRQRGNVPFLERLPAAIATLLIVLSIFSPRLLDSNTQWALYFRVQQIYYRLTSNPMVDSEPVLDQRSILKAQQHLFILGYDTIVETGEYDVATDTAIKDFQSRMGLKNTRFMDYATLELLASYAYIKQRDFTN